MNSYCIKTNNNKIINYLLNKIEASNINNIYYCSKQFKIYNNVILHYKGENSNEFYEALSEILTDTILKFYEEKIIKKIINFNYFYFDDFEKNIIYENCKELINAEKNDTKQILIYKEILKYLLETKSIILDGFITFRLNEYIKYIDNQIDTGVNKYIIEKEYTEFISLLRIYVESRSPDIEILHLIYINGESILLDENKNIVSISENITNAKYLSDISFSSNDYALNTLLSLLPKKINIHLIGNEDEFINTIKLIFENKVYICKDCNICRTYKLINNVKILQ